MSEMVERVARAIAARHGTDPDQEGPGQRHVIDVDGVPTIITDHIGPLWKMWIPDARAAIKAMREPPAEMLLVGAANISPWWSPAMQKSADYGNAVLAADSAWNGMIDAALKAP